MVRFWTFTAPEGYLFVGFLVLLWSRPRVARPEDHIPVRSTALVNSFRSILSLLLSFLSLLLLLPFFLLLPSLSLFLFLFLPIVSLPSLSLVVPCLFYFPFYGQLLWLIDLFVSFLVFLLYVLVSFLFLAFLILFPLLFLLVSCLIFSFLSSPCLFPCLPVGHPLAKVSMCLPVPC